jgi:hypothetical protein
LGVVAAIKSGGKSERQGALAVRDRQSRRAIRGTGAARQQIPGPYRRLQLLMLAQQGASSALVLDGRENAIGAAVSAKGLRSKVIAENSGRTDNRKEKSVGL